MDLELKGKVAIVGGASKGTSADVVTVAGDLDERMLSNVVARAKELGIPLDDALAQRAAETAVGRIGEPREMANLVACLASARSSYVTGRRSWSTAASCAPSCR